MQIGARGQQRQADVRVVGEWMEVCVGKEVEEWKVGKRDLISDVARIGH